MSTTTRPDIAEGIMVNVPRREAQARLVGVTSEIYSGDFWVVADRLNDPLARRQSWLLQ